MVKLLFGVRRGEVYRRLGKFKEGRRQSKAEKKVYEQELKKAKEEQAELRLVGVRQRARKEAREELRTGKGRTRRKVERYARQAGRGAARWSGEFLGPQIVPPKIKKRKGQRRKRYHNPLGWMK